MQFAKGQKAAVAEISFHKNIHSRQWRPSSQHPAEAFATDCKLSGWWRMDNCQGSGESGESGYGADGAVLGGRSYLDLLPGRIISD